MGQPLMLVRVQAGGGAASYAGPCAGWGWGSLLCWYVYRLGVGQPLMMVRVQAGGGAASYDGTCAGWGWGSLL